MKTILSLKNSHIQTAVKLKTAKGRKQYQQFIVEGRRSIETFIDNNYKPCALFVTQNNKDFGANLEIKETFLVSQSIMAKLSNATSPSGILALFEIPENPSADTLSKGIVLANITDPGNMGTLIRSAAAFNATSVIIIDGCDPFLPKVIQATAGTLPQVKLFLWTWKELMQYKKEYTLAALVVKDGTSIDQLPKKTLLVVGNEAHGIKQEWLQDCSQKITLTMQGKTESLNASIAGSIALYYLQFTK